MDSRKFTLAMRALDFVEKLCLNSPDDTTNQAPLPERPAPPPKPKEANLPFTDRDVDRKLNDALNSLIMSAPAQERPEIDKDLDIDPLDGEEIIE